MRAGETEVMAEKIRTRTLGCKVNYADTQAIASLLPALASTSIEIIASCCVTAEGEKQSRKEARRASRRVGDDGLVFVTGCAARMKPETFTGMGANVTVVNGSPREAAAAITSIAGLESSPEANRGEGQLRERTRFFLKVQDGCSNMCSYCVVPLARGKPVSIDSGRLLEVASEQVSRGYPELVVSGINVGAYDDGAMKLPELMVRLAGIEGLARLRLSSIEVTHITPQLLEVMGERKKIARHLHVPLQSGDDRVLAAMKRRYDRGAFISRVAEVRQALEGVNLTTDIIVGFPGEDGQAFQATLDCIEAMAFTRVHTFMYSRRPGTAAAAIDESVNGHEKKARSRRVLALSRALQQRHRERKVGQVSEVLLESDTGDGLNSGYSGDYTRFIVSGGSPGQIVAVRGESVEEHGVLGKVVAHV